MNGQKSAIRRGLTTLTTAVLSLALVTVVGCKATPAGKAATTPPAMLVGPENIAVVKGEQLRSGPAIFGTLQPESRRTYAPKRSRPFLQTLAESGQTVSRGQTFARIDYASLQASVLSAQAAATTAKNTVDLNKRQVDRNAALLKAGAIAERDLEMSQNQLSSAQAQLANAKSMLANANKQLAGDVVAPFTERARGGEPATCATGARWPHRESGDDVARSVGAGGP
jgi:multidrug efflux pump subunit AcrA (membrane-fusion protein)